MREKGIKMENSRFEFRAWNKELKKLGEVYGFDKYRVFASFDRDTDEDAMYELPRNNDVVLMQYTGLKDKNGVKIFEGDIVKIKDCYTNGVKTSDMVGEIVFFECEFQVKDKCDNYLPIYRYKDRNEVIGNIYQNQELLGE